jgi:DNA repair protein RadC
MADQPQFTIPVPTVTLLAEQPLSSYTDRDQIQGPDDAVEVVRPLLTGIDREIGVIVSVDTRHRVIAVDTVSVGTAQHTFFAPREVLRTVLHRGSSAFFVAHNHPSGDPEPSTDDRLITRRLRQAGELVGVDLLDHVVIGDGAIWISLARVGVI